MNAIDETCLITDQLPISSPLQLPLSLPSSFPISLISAELTNQMMKLSSNAPVVVITQSSTGLVEEHIFASKAALAQSTQFFHNHSFDIKSIFNTTSCVNTPVAPLPSLSSLSSSSSLVPNLPQLSSLPIPSISTSDVGVNNDNNQTQKMSTLSMSRNNRCDIEIGLHMGPFYYDHKSSDDICSACGTVAHNLKTSINTISNTTVAPAFQPPKHGPIVSNVSNFHSSFDTIAFNGNVSGSSNNNRSSRAPTTAVCRGTTVTIHPSLIPADDLRATMNGNLHGKRGKKRKTKTGMNNMTAYSSIDDETMEQPHFGASGCNGGGAGSDDEYSGYGNKHIISAGSNLFGPQDSDDGLVDVGCGVEIVNQRTEVHKDASISTNNTHVELKGVALIQSASNNGLNNGNNVTPSFTASATSSHRKTIKLITPGNSSMRAELLKQKHLRQRGPPLLGQVENVILETPKIFEKVTFDDNDSDVNKTEFMTDDTLSNKEAHEKRLFIAENIMSNLTPSPKVSEAGVGSTSIYDPLKYFEDFIDHFNATDKPIFVEVIDAIENEFMKRGIEVSVITPHADFKEVLRHLNYNRLYPFIPQIRYRLTGEPPLRVSPIERTLLLEQYRLTIFNWPLIVKGHNRKSVVNVPVLFNFLCDLNKFTVHLNNPDFSRDNLMVNRKKLHSIVHEILYPAVELGLIPKITNKKN